MVVLVLFVICRPFVFQSRLAPLNRVVSVRGKLIELGVMLIAVCLKLILMKIIIVLVLSRISVLLSVLKIVPGNSVRGRSPFLKRCSHRVHQVTF